MKFNVKESQAGERLDNVVHSRLPQLSRSFVQRLCDEQHITINKKVSKPGHKVHAGDKINVDYNLSQLEDIPNISLPILYEDDDVIVINKPPGVLTHSKGAYNPEGTVATFISPKLQDMSGERGGIVHRLDRFTSGVIICAKNQATLSWLQKQFATRSVKKTYIAIVEGTLEPEQAIIDMPIERHPKKPKIFRAGPGGKPATTRYEVTKTNSHFSQIELTPTTGRTHQLRVHLSQLKRPILGDIVYGGKPAERLYLHALSLEITLPSHARKIFKAPLPSEFTRIMK